MRLKRSLEDRVSDLEKQRDWQTEKPVLFNTATIEGCLAVIAYQLGRLVAITKQGDWTAAEEQAVEKKLDDLYKKLAEKKLGQ